MRPEEYEALGVLIVAAYEAVEPGGVVSYAHELRDVTGRVDTTEVLVASDGDGVVLGGVTYVPGPDSPWAEYLDPGAAGIRMLAVAARAQGRGVGAALVQACIDRARAAGKAQIVLHTTDWMTTAHRLYQRAGFERDTSIDWEPEPGFWLRGYRLRL